MDRRHEKAQKRGRGAGQGDNNSIRSRSLLCIKVGNKSELSQFSDSNKKC